MHLYCFVLLYFYYFKILRHLNLLNTKMRFSTLLLFSLISFVSFSQEDIYSPDLAMESLPDSIYYPYSFQQPVKSSSRLLDSVYYLLYSPDQTSWENYQNISYDYNEQGKLTTINTSLWDSGLSIWAAYSKEERVYEDNNRLSNIVSSKWSAISANWELSSRREYYYNASSLLDHYLVFSWNVITSGWDSLSMYSYLFDGNNNLINYKRQYWLSDSSGFINDYQFLYEYADNKKSAMTRMKWDTSQHSWNNQNHSSYDYNADLLSSEIQSKWDNNTTDWVPSSLITYSYSDFDNPIEKKYQSWDGLQWNNVVKYEYSYNEQLQNTLIQYFIWDNSIWNVNTRYIYEYDLYEDLVSEESHNWKDNSWHYYDRLEYYYSAELSAGHPDPGKSIQVFPNPFRDALTIILAEKSTKVNIDIYSLAGIKLYSYSTYNSSFVIKLQNLPDGIYLLKISGSGFNYTGKIIRRK